MAGCNSSTFDMLAYAGAQIAAIAKPVIFARNFELKTNFMSFKTKAKNVVITFEHTVFFG